MCKRWAQAPAGETVASLRASKQIVHASDARSAGAAKDGMADRSRSRFGGVRGGAGGREGGRGCREARTMRMAVMVPVTTKGATYHHCHPPEPSEFAGLLGEEKFPERPTKSVGKSESWRVWRRAMMGKVMARCGEGVPGMGTERTGARRALDGIGASF